MAEIALFHPSIMRSGGGESVAAHALNALSTHHDITLYSLDEPDFETLDKRHGTTLTDWDIRYRNPLPLLEYTLRPALSAINRLFGTSLQLDALSSAFVQAAGRHCSFEQFDLLLSTGNEFFADVPVIQYIHFPAYTRLQHARYEPWAPSAKYRLYRSLCSRIANPREKSPEEATFLVNSDWTADLVREAYDMNVRVLYPPVSVSDFAPVDWTEKEDGFVTVGRIHPSKEQHTMIEILDRLHDRGANHHLHIVGGIADESYASEIRRLAAEREYVHLEGYLERDELTQLVEKHRYGLHARKYEHFGIAVAELVAGGCIPFVPRGGGQMETVGERDNLMYRTPEEAADNILSVTNERELQEDIREHLRECGPDLSVERFARELNDLVAETLSNV